MKLKFGDLQIPEMKQHAPQPRIKLPGQPPEGRETGMTATSTAPATITKIDAAAIAPTETPRLNLSRGLIYGSGMTKRDVERASKNFDAVQEQASSATNTSEVLDRAMHALKLALPTTLMDDKLVLDESQERAINGMLQNKRAVMIGAAGSGKTTCTKALIHRLLQTIDEPHIALCAFTGRAVQQMKRALPVEYHSYCSTIHRLLGFAPVEEERWDSKKGEYRVVRGFKPTYTAENKMPYNTIFMDEAGMTGCKLWNQFMDACTDDCRIYLIGDINQLPPVQDRSVLGFAMLEWPVFELTKIHRTQENALIGGAHAILAGKMPQQVDGKVAMVRLDDGSTKAFMQFEASIQKLSRAGKFDPLRDAIIVPQNKDMLGQENLNERFMTFFNPPQQVEGLTVNPRTIITAGFKHKTFAVGDKVMVTQNDNDIGLTNGMIGVLESIIPNPKFKGEAIGDMAAAHMAEDIDFNMDDFTSAMADMEMEVSSEDNVSERERQASHILRVKFQNLDEAVEFSTAGGVNTLMHAYAITCHKSQGGEYPVVCVLMHSANWRMLSREWFYTAWTRTQETVIVFYNTRGLQMALNRQIITGRTLQEKARKFIELQKSLADDAQPNLAFAK